jgi:hypothetical protein
MKIVEKNIENKYVFLDESTNSFVHENTSDWFVDKEINEGGVDKETDAGGVDKETDEGGVDKETGKGVVNNQLEGKNVFVIFIVKKNWLPYYFSDCEEWINITYPINTPFILGVYYNKICADRMIEILDLSLSVDSKKIVDFYSREMSGSEFVDTCTSHIKHDYLNHIIYDHIYCNGSWINAYQLINRIERKYKRKRKLSNNTTQNTNNQQTYEYLFNHDNEEASWN